MSESSDSAPTPADPSHASAARAELDTYYEVCRQVARDRGLMLVDHYPNWVAIHARDQEKFDRLVPDGIHPSDAGTSAVLIPELMRALSGRPVK